MVQEGMQRDVRELKCVARGLQRGRERKIDGKHVNGWSWVAKERE